MLKSNKNISCKFIGCESCGCNTEFAVGGTCDPITGQCACLEGVIGQNCDHCPDHWVLVVNETRTVKPEWKRPFNYDEVKSLIPNNYQNY